MRTIKFRAWNGREFIKDRYNHNHFISIDGGKLVQVQHDDFCDEGIVYGKPESVILQQFTGLTDINGVEIYEGDIVRLSFDDGVTEMFKVVYKAPAFRLEGFGIWSLASQSASTEVIGNIYQNPELMK